MSRGSQKLGGPCHWAPRHLHSPRRIETICCGSLALAFTVFATFPLQIPEEQIDHTRHAVELYVQVCFTAVNSSVQLRIYPVSGEAI